MASNILVVDCSSVMHRAKHSIGETLHYMDMSSGVVFGFFWSLFKLSKEYKTTQIVFCLDSKTSKRMQMFPAYKENRAPKEKTPEQLQLDRVCAAQFKKIPKMLVDLGFGNVLHAEGFEADDVIASVCHNNTSLKDSLILVSEDQDLYQLLDFCKGQHRDKRLYTSEDFETEWGIEPEQWKLVKAYSGCSTDRVPGIQGFGEATAIKFIKTRPLKGVLSQRFHSSEGRSIIERNKKLTTLPFEGTPVFRLGKKDNLNWDYFLDICSMYGIDSFLSNPKNFAFWKSFFLEGGF